MQCLLIISWFWSLDERERVVNGDERERGLIWEGNAEHDGVVYIYLSKYMKMKMDMEEDMGKAQ